MDSTRASERQFTTVAMEGLSLLWAEASVSLLRCSNSAHIEEFAVDLKDFISTSLTQIAEGILAASDALKDTDALVNPTQITLNSNSSQGFARTLAPGDKSSLSVTRVVERVTFDVAVSTEGETQGKAGLKVGVASFGVNVGGDMKEKAGKESRIQFTIPMVFPSARTKTDE